MKKLLCYLGIVVLLGLTLFPPILRIALPKENKKQEKNTITDNFLSCQNDLFIVKGNYENKKLKMIVIKKMFVTEEASDESKVSNELVETFDSLKENNNIIHKVLEDGEVISIDLTLSDLDNLNINNLTYNLDDQKLYFENQQLICSVE